MSRLRITIVLVCILMAATGFAQKFSYGVGAAANFGFFSIEDQQAVVDNDYNIPGTVGAGISFLVDYQGTGRFSVRAAPTINTKRIRFAENLEGIDPSNVNYLAIDFIALDLGLSGRFLVPLSSWQFTPFAGLNFSFNKHTDSFFKSFNSSDHSTLIVQQISQGNSFGPDELSIQPGILAGFAFGRKNGQLELESKIIYTPINFVDGDTVIPISARTNIPLEGKYQYIAVGLNFKFG